ncbi:MAG: PAS domain-containing protein [Candidatus Latescibacteria bacterium]|nr:PAS domain-containing protein [Candidatus Latescibacterota bacterium]
MTDWQFTPIAYAYFFSAAGAFLLTFYAYRLRPVRGATYFCMLTMSVGIWTLGYILGLLNPTLNGKFLYLRLEYLGIISTNIFLLVFIITYIYRNYWLKPYVIALLSIIPIFTYAQILTVDQHDFFYRVYEVTTVNGLIVSKKVYGPGFYIWTLFAYSTFIFDEILLIWSIYRMPEQFRKQAVPLVAIAALTMIPNFLYITGTNPIAPFDPTPLPFVVATFLFVFLIRQYGFLNIVPVAHNLIFKNVNSGIIILDERQHIIDINITAENMISNTKREVLGRPLNNCFPEFKNHDQAKENNIEVEKEGRIYELQSPPLLDYQQEYAGHILMLYDVTARTRLEQEQNLLIEELQTALDQVKTLTGLLPICANCKQIRDDEGDWQQVESYIQNRSSANFTHSICPACVETLYPDVIKQRKQ